MAKSEDKTVSRTQKGALSLSGTTTQDLAFGELRDRLLGELDGLAELERAGVGAYKLVLIVKRTKKKPLSYKLVVERSQ